MRGTRITHRLVEFVPDELEPETVYVSMEHATVVHNCLCGCGGRVMTPLAPTEWRMTYDGETITLAPSIGNWSFACQSHYVIRRNEVIWMTRMSRAKIEAGRERDRRDKEGYYPDVRAVRNGAGDSAQRSRAGSWRRLLRLPSG